MSQLVTYVLAVRVPDLTPEDRALVIEHVEPHDTDLGVRRYLGGLVSEAEENLADLLPDGWGVSIAEVPHE